LTGQTDHVCDARKKEMPGVWKGKRKGRIETAHRQKGEEEARLKSSFTRP